MRFSAFRVVRAATVTIPSIWFVYVVHSVFFLPDADPELELGVGRARRGGGGGGGLGRLGDGLANNSIDNLPNDRALWKHGDDGNGINLQRNEENLQGNEDDLQRNGGIFQENEREDDGNDDIIHRNGDLNSNNGAKLNGGVNQGGDVVGMEMNQGDVDNPGVDADAHQQAGDNDRPAAAAGNPDPVLEAPHPLSENHHDVAQGHDVDPYVNVTYPPFVERLPSNAKGQGKGGLYMEQKNLPEAEQKVWQEKWDKNSFNQYVSDLIPVHRELPDFRNDECKQKQYPFKLPNISVVIIFHNEAWSVLLRSVHSILDRTRADLLVEVILVDDFSSMEHLKAPLDKYFRDYPKVKIVRCPERGGLTKARNRGFDVTTGEVVVFLDSHIECTEGWAEPMLWMITENYRTVPFPTIDLINTNDLSYSHHTYSPYGVFNLNSLTFKWSSNLQRPTIPFSDPKPSPTMPGGLFAIHRKWFLELGKYDPELDYWGGENMELSFKVWMCGGSVVIAQCSHIGHIFRHNNPIKWTSGNLGNRNYVRVAMVWMDEYKNHYLERTMYRAGDYGDISARVELRKSLECHGFDWYVQNVYPELMEQIVTNATYAGEVVHEQSKLCLDKMDDKHVGPQLFSCHHQGSNQFWYFRDNKHLQIETTFLCKRDEQVKLCSHGTKDEFSYNETTHQLIHVESGLCLQKNLDTEDSNKLVKFLPCSPTNGFQKWRLEKRQPFKYTR